MKTNGSGMAPPSTGLHLPNFIQPPSSEFDHESSQLILLWISRGWSAKARPRTHRPFRGLRCHGAVIFRTSALLLSLCSHLLLLHCSIFSTSVSPLSLHPSSSSKASQAPPPPPPWSIARSLPPSLILYLSPSLLLPFISPPAIRSKPARFHSLSPLTLCAPSCLLLLLLLLLSLSLLVAPLLSGLLLSAFAEESGPVGTKTDSVFGGKTLCVCACVCECVRWGGGGLQCIVFLL